MSQPRSVSRFAVNLLAVLMASTVPTLGSETVGADWVCPPCGSPCDEKSHERPGHCPVCGMQLIRRNEMQHVAILLFEGVQIIDYTGPYEVLGQAGLGVYTVSETGKTLTTNMGMTVTPKHSFATAPAPDILVVPGGNAQEAYDNPRVVEWVQKSAAGADHVLSVCNGAFILAKAGLLDGQKATTFYGLIDELREFAPKTAVVRDQRFVDNGKVITSAGLSSGIDAALYLVSKIRGEVRAQELARHIEYDWNPESGYARAALADLRLPAIDPPDGAVVTVVSSVGDRNRWDKRIRIATELTLGQLRTYLVQRIAALDGWSRDGAPATPETSAREAWTVTDGAGSRWHGVSAVEPEGEGTFLVTFQVAKPGA